MSGHTHKGRHNTGPARPEKLPRGGGHLPEHAAEPSWFPPRSQDVGSCRSQGLGCERSPVLTPISMTRQTCSFRFFKQNPPLKMYLQTFLCHRLILDIARICSFPGLTAPSTRRGGPQADSCRPRAHRLSCVSHQAPPGPGRDEWPVRPKARHSHVFFKTSMSVVTLASVLWKRGPLAEPGPGPSIFS